MNIGIIAEDNSDFAVLREITLKLLGPHTIVGFKKCLGRGGGGVRRKCGAFATNLVERGCSYVIAMHDLDQHDERELRALIQNAITCANARCTVVLIPKHEIESWLMHDAEAIAETFKQGTHVRLPTNPEAIRNPKEHLGHLIAKHYGKIYLNTTHNEQIAKRMKVSCLNGAKSFAPHPRFIAQIKADLKG